MDHSRKTKYLLYSNILFRLPCCSNTGDAFFVELWVKESVTMLIVIHTVHVCLRYYCHAVRLNVTLFRSIK